MKEQKNIERLFQEKFKDFEVAAPETAWKNIELKLTKKEKKRRAIPFWFKASGIAASLVLGYYLYSFFYNPKNDIKIDKNSIVIDENNKTIQNQNNSIIDKTKNIENTIKSKNNVLTEVDKSLNSNTVENNKDNSISNKNQKETTFNFIKKQNLLSNSNKNKEQNKNQLNHNDFKNNVLEPNKNNIENKNIVTTEIDFNKTNKGSSDKNSFVAIDKLINNKTQDSSLIVKISEEVSTLEQLLKEKEVGKNVEEKEKKMTNKWAISTVASPVYFNSVSNNSTLDSRFDANEKKSNTNISYGLGLTYSINNKLSIRTGISNLNFNSNTKDIVFNQDTHTKPIENVSRNARGKLVNVENKVVNARESLNIFGNVVKEYDGELKQNIAYVEVPFELSYKLVNKKFGIDIIGGVSTLFLNSNSVSIVSDNMIMEIGKINNLNNVHFSSNIGFGLKYAIFKSFNANVNPMFKYQINTYTDNSNNVKPYFIGVYSGLSYSF